MASDPMTGAPPKVFISYSHDTIAHQERVLGLADRLRAEGIDAEIDQYNPAPPESWALWCERQIAAADVVLMVCTETYHRRVSGDEERGKGLGVVWEARIIRQHLYDTGAVNDKFVPVLFSDASPEQIPMPIKGGTRYVVDTEHGYEELYRRLTRQPRLVRPELGAIRPLPPRRRQWTEAQSEEATTAPTPSSSAARSPEDGTVTAAGGRSVAIGGNMTGTAVTGDHNVTSITTASDHNEVRRHHLQEFSHSAECDTFIRQLRAHHTKLFKSARPKIFLFPPIFFIFWVSCFVRNIEFSGFVVFVLFIFYPVVAIIYFIYIYKLYSLARADVYPAIILEKHATSEKILNNTVHKWHILLQKSDGSRKEVVATQVYFNIPQWEIGVAAERNGKLLSFTEIDNLHKTEIHDIYK